MKKADVVAIIYALICACIVVFFPFEIDKETGKIAFKFYTNGQGILNFGGMSKAFPFFMGFMKVAFLATFGEMIKSRGKTGSYKIDIIPIRWCVWGLYGMMFTIAFPIFDAGVKGLIAAKLWFPAEPGSLLYAFSCSFLINMVFAYPMMLSHEWFNAVLAKRRFVGGAEFLESIDKNIWGSFIPKTVIFFWIPAHTFTFSLPPHYRILSAAFLSLALGFLLTFKAKPKK